MAIIPTPPPATNSTSAIPAGAQAQLQQLGEVVVEQVPERIAQLARSILLSGTIVEQKQGGAVVLRTQVGELIIRSQTPLPLDKVLTLQIPPGAPPVRAQVTIAQPIIPPPAGVALPVPQASPNLPAGASGPLPVTAPTQTPGAIPITTPPRSPVTGAQPQAPVLSVPSVLGGPLISTPNLVAATQAIASLPLLPGTVLPAQVLALPNPAVANPATQAPLPPALSTFVAVQKAGAPVLQSLLPQGLSELLAKLPAAVLAPVSTAVSAAPTLPLAATSTPAFANLPVLLTLPAGSQVTLQIDKITLPPVPLTPQGSAVATVPNLAAALPAVQQPGIIRQPPSFGAVVIGQTPQGEPLATSPAGLLVLPSKTPLQPGTMVDLSLLHVAEPALEAPGELPARLRDWPVLQQILQLSTVPNSAPAVRTTRPDNLGGMAAFLAAALKLGEPQRIVSSETLEQLRRSGQGELITRLAAEVQQAGQSFNKPDAPATDWRSLSLPLPLESQMQRLALHIRREADPDNPSAGPSAGKRLVIEVELSRLGPLLLDGFIRPKRFDVLLRSQRRLPQKLQGELRLAYRESLTSLGWQGGLEFQTAAELWLRG
jgi:hypothetical protein